MAEFVKIILFLNLNLLMFNDLFSNALLFTFKYFIFPCFSQIFTRQNFRFHITQLNEKLFKSFVIQMEILISLL
jgi:hypothetical protein